MRKIKRNTVNNENLTNKFYSHITKICFHINMFCSYIQKRICLQIQKPHSKLPRQILEYEMQRGYICDNWKISFLPLLIFNWRTFSRRVIARRWRQSAKNKVLTNQKSRNRWCQIVRRAIWRILCGVIL